MVQKLFLLPIPRGRKEKMEQNDKIITTVINENNTGQDSAKNTENVLKEDISADKGTDDPAIASYPLYSEVSNATDHKLEETSTFKQMRENISNFFSGLFNGIKKFFRRLKSKLSKKGKKEVVEDKSKEVAGVIEVADEKSETSGGKVAEQEASDEKSDVKNDDANVVDAKRIKENED